MVRVNFKNNTKNNLNQYEVLAGHLFKSAVMKTKLFSDEQSVFIDLNIVGTKKIQKLNLQYRNKNAITDVLSFSIMEGDNFKLNYFPTMSLGEIYICWNKVLDDAKKYSLSVKREFSYLFIHGVLHIFGYDHKLPAEEKRMNDLSESILKSFKIVK